MAERKAISKKVRFDVFKRDNFACQYCGCTPPNVVLEIDHIHPVSKGGKNDVDNLITACFNCNRGKSDGLLTSVPDTINSKAEIMAEKEEQIKAFNRLLANKRRREDKQISQLEEIFDDTFDGYSWKPKFRESIRSNFMPYLTQDQLIAAISKACSKCYDREAASKYFCGICWNMRREVDGTK